MKPMLWRLRAYRAPGFPSPAMTSMGSPIDQREPLAPCGAESPAPASDRTAIDALGPSFLAAGLAAAGAAAPFAGAAAAPFAGAAAAPLPAPAAGAAPAAGVAPAAGATAAPGAGGSLPLTRGG